MNKPNSTALDVITDDADERPDWDTVIAPVLHNKAGAAFRDNADWVEIIEMTETPSILAELQRLKKTALGNLPEIAQRPDIMRIILQCQKIDSLHVKELTGLPDLVQTLKLG